MAFRNKARLSCLVVLTSFVVGAAEFPVEHVRLGRNESGVLEINNDGIRFEQARHPHSYLWKWDDIQRLALSPDRIEITTYKDVRWLAGRDRKFSFTGENLTAAYPLLRDALPRRFVPDVARTDFEPAGKYPAKRLEGWGGHKGTLLIGNDRIVFVSEDDDGSHTWMLYDVENVSSSDPLKLTVASLGEEYRLQLKNPMPEAVYNGLWRKLNVRRTH